MAKRKMPVRIATFQLDGDFEGWEFTARTNPPVKLLRTLTAGDIGGIIDALSQMVLGWNFVDEEGEAIPAPNSLIESDGSQKEMVSTDESLGLVPIDLLTLMAEQIASKIGEVPKA